MVACGVSQHLCQCPADAFPWWHHGYSLLQVPWLGPLQSELQASLLRWHEGHSLLQLPWER